MQTFGNSVASFFQDLWVHGGRYPLNISDPNILCDFQQCPTCDVNETCQNMCRVWICCFLSCVFDFVFVFVIDDVLLWVDVLWVCMYCHKTGINMRLNRNHKVLCKQTAWRLWFRISPDLDRVTCEIESVTIDQMLGHRAGHNNYELIERW